MEDSEDTKSELKEVKDLFDKQQKLDRMIRKCFKLTKFYRHCDSIFHINNIRRNSYDLSVSA